MQPAFKTIVAPSVAFRTGPFRSASALDFMDFHVNCRLNIRNQHCQIEWLENHIAGGVIILDLSALESQL